MVEERDKDNFLRVSSLVQLYTLSLTYVIMR